MDIITLAHGVGGQLTWELIERLLYKYFKNDLLLQGNDSTILPAARGRLLWDLLLKRGLRLSNWRE